MFLDTGTVVARHDMCSGISSGVPGMYVGLFLKQYYTLSDDNHHNNVCMYLLSIYVCLYLRVYLVCIYVYTWYVCTQYVCNTCVPGSAVVPDV